MLTSLISELQKGANLSSEQVDSAVELLTSESGRVEEKAEFLSALAQKGETSEEIAAFARNLRGRSIQPPISHKIRQEELLDVCGTGGDKLNTFNISTCVAIAAASAGVKVAKHGNRAITSKSGSADVLEALGIPIALPPESAARALEDHGFAFFFAPAYHPAFKNIAPARKLCAERGQRTIFNFLGPLLNPAKPTAQLLGVPSPALCEPLAKVLQLLGTRRAMVVSGKVEEAYLDELSTMGATQVAEFYQDRGFHSSVLDHRDFPLLRATLADLQGGDRETNARITRQIFSGTERGPKRDAVVLNTAAALFVANKVKTISEGLELAAHILDSGLGEKKLRELSEAIP